MTKLKNHKIWLELIAKEGTPDGGLEIKKAGKIFKAFHNLARKNNFECHVMGIPKLIIDYEPTGKEIRIESLYDIIDKLTLEQFEMFIIDLRKWFEQGREIKKMSENKEFYKKLLEPTGVEIKFDENLQYIKEGMRWLDTGENKVITNITIEQL